MDWIDAICITCHRPIRWLPGTPRLCKVHAFEQRAAVMELQNDGSAVAVDASEAGPDSQLTWTSISLTEG